MTWNKTCYVTIRLISNNKVNILHIQRFSSNWRTLLPSSLDNNVDHLEQLRVYIRPVKIQQLVRKLDISIIHQASQFTLPRYKNVKQVFSTLNIHRVIVCPIVGTSSWICTCATYPEPSRTYHSNPEPIFLPILRRLPKHVRQGIQHSN